MQELFSYEKKFYDDINFVGYMWQETAADHSRKVGSSYHSNNFQKNRMFTT